MEKIEEIISILNKIELQYKEMQALTYELQKSLSGGAVSTAACLYLLY